MSGLFAKKLLYWYRKHGATGLIVLATVRFWRKLFGRTDVLFSIDSSDLPDSCPSAPEGVTVERYASAEEISREDMDRMASFKGGEEILERFLKSLFRRGAVLWLVKLNGEVAGYHWSAIGGYDRFYLSPMTERDAILVSSEVFEPYRGRGLNPAMIRHILHALKDEGVTRMYIACKTWNAQNLRSIPKTGFKVLSKVTLYEAFGRRISVWSKASDDSQRKGPSC